MESGLHDHPAWVWDDGSYQVDRPVFALPIMQRGQGRVLSLLVVPTERTMPCTYTRVGLLEVRVYDSGHGPSWGAGLGVDLQTEPVVIDLV